jgi:hypothetical protein
MLHSSGQEILAILCPVSTIGQNLRQLIIVFIFINNFFRIHFIIDLPSTPRSPKWSLALEVFQQDACLVSPACAIFPDFHPSRFYAHTVR